MSGFEGDADFAVGLEPADAGAMPGTWVNDHEGSTRGVDLSIRWRNNPHKSIIDRAIERAAIKYQLDLVFENVRYCLGQMVTVLIAALAHDVPEQDVTLRGVDHVIHCRSKPAQK
jgi:hypothetical protein